MSPTAIRIAILLFGPSGGGGGSCAAERMPPPVVTNTLNTIPFKTLFILFILI
jgi:hypothetical protein